MFALLNLLSFECDRFVAAPLALALVTANHLHICIRFANCLLCFGHWYCFSFSIDAGPVILRRPLVCILIYFALWHHSNSWSLCLLSDVLVQSFSVIICFGSAVEAIYFWRSFPFRFGCSYVLRSFALNAEASHAGIACHVLLCPMRRALELLIRTTVVS